MSIEKLLKELNNQINYLSYSIRIPGMDKDDVAQELRLMVLKEYKKFGNKYKSGWWFRRLKWYALNLLEKEKKEPVNKSVRIEKFRGIR